MSDPRPIDQIKELLQATPLEEDASVEQMRENMSQLAGMFQPAESCKIEPEVLGGVKAESNRAANASDARQVLYFHGGGYVIGGVDTHRSLVAKLSETSGAVVHSLEYRLAPEDPFPAAVDDALAAYKALLEKHDASSIAISGDSAGGGLTFALLLKIKEEGLPQPACAAPISPWTDLTGEAETLITLADKDPMVQKEPLLAFAAHYRAGQDAKHPLISPLFADLSGLPPLLIIVGTDEVLLDDSRNIHANAQKAGVSSTLEVWEDMIHVWPLFHQILPEGAQAVEKMGMFMQRCWDEAKSKAA